MQYPVDGFGNVFLTVITIGSLLFYVPIAIGVYKEASDRAAAGRKLWFMGPGLWMIATLLGGVFTAATYWVMHHSKLAQPEAASSDDE